MLCTWYHCRNGGREKTLQNYFQTKKSLESSLLWICPAPGGKLVKIFQNISTNLVVRIYQQILYRTCKYVHSFKDGEGTWKSLWRLSILGGWALAARNHRKHRKEPVSRAITSAPTAGNRNKTTRNRNKQKTALEKTSCNPKSSRGAQ